MSAGQPLQLAPHDRIIARKLAFKVPKRLQVRKPKQLMLPGLAHKKTAEATNSGGHSV